MAEPYSKGAQFTALRIWQILIGVAHNRQLITYDILAELLGFKGAGAFADPLDWLAKYCESEKLFPLTCLVVNSNTGLPGGGIKLEGSKLHAAREQVFNYEWYRRLPPTDIQLDEYRGTKKRNRKKKAPAK